ncbi:Cobyrinic acid a,c-diamide synthase [Rhodopseudomonas palustris HaA2]|uniref:Cobyrinic acid a,c-diamide synthase n=1 Tax=Rhodopseudomonas palustris (strain HaA2) TaxID=316058 RepID=Q2IZ30_RHOP2|nr:AAA family ATPase [Rhodopseudomonas palustris]ABD06530.1 Cobyrinic acid a,c-diamide synthase [Rhodopseudomonas palustris HaA2]
MSAKIIAVANMKGGVGKTTTVVSLGEALAASGHRVLVIDLDAQANASICIAGDSMLATLMSRGATIEGFLADNLLGKQSMAFTDAIRNNISNVTHLGEQLNISLLPSSPELRNFEQRIIYELTGKKWSWEQIVDGLFAVMKRQLDRTRKDFDYILIDCAPGISVLTEVSIRLADLVMVPTIADFLSTFGLQNFCITLSDRGLSSGAKKAAKYKQPHVLITRRRKVKVHDETANKLRNEETAAKPAFRMFETEIPEAVAVSEALGKITQFPSFSQKWGQVVTPLLADLVKEVEEVLHGHRR